MTNKLFIKISLAFLGILAVLGFAYVMITSYIGEQYFQEVNQKLYGDISENTVKVVKPLVNGQVDTIAIQDIMHSIMVINPSAEVYLLDTEGTIITYAAPHKKIKLKEVNLDPIKTFIAAEEKPFIKGDDPRHPGEFKVFSAAPIKEAGVLQGYMYMILASEEQAAVASNLQGSYMQKLGVNLFLVSLIGALIIGLLAIWFITKNLRKIIDVVKRFKEGDLHARVAEENKGDLVLLADTYNEMADTIVTNIDELKSVENLRRELIANVSHDLRTPLAIIQGYAETLQMKGSQLEISEKEKYLNIILGSSEKLSRLIEQLFEYSKLEAKQIKAQKEPFFLQELIQDIVQKNTMLAESKDIQLQLATAQELPLVFADISLVDRAIQNLIDNALKFTPKGGKVTVHLNKSNDNVSVQVSDNGPGISKDKQLAIFERYEKTNRSSNTGAGLGLAIVKKILELHESSIEVTSKLQEGTTFQFVLPAYVAS